MHKYLCPPHCIYLCVRRCIVAILVYLCVRRCIVATCNTHTLSHGICLVYIVCVGLCTQCWSVRNVGLCTQCGCVRNVDVYVMCDYVRNV